MAFGLLPCSSSGVMLCVLLILCLLLALQSWVLHLAVAALWHSHGLWSALLLKLRRDALCFAYAVLAAGFL